MRVHFDQESDALYFQLGDCKVVESEQVKPGIVLDFNEQNQVVGVEILDAGERVPEASLKQMYFEMTQKT